MLDYVEQDFLGHGKGPFLNGSQIGIADIHAVSLQPISQCELANRHMITDLDDQVGFTDTRRCKGAGLWKRRLPQGVQVVSCFSSFSSTEHMRAARLTQWQQQDRGSSTH